MKRRRQISVWAEAKNSAMVVELWDRDRIGEMPEQIEIAEAIPIREAGLDEYWLQNQIADNPACLGLRDLELVSKERSQSSGGRLDILFENGRRFNVRSRVHA